MVSTEDTLYIVPSVPGAILKLVCSGNLRTCRWVEMPHDSILNGRRENLRAELVPDHMANCFLRTTTTTTTTPSPMVPTGPTTEPYEDNRSNDDEI